MFIKVIAERRLAMGKALFLWIELRIKARGFTRERQWLESFAMIAAATLADIHAASEVCPFTLHNPGASPLG